jgi:hypothetical protein
MYNKGKENNFMAITTIIMVYNFKDNLAFIGLDRDSKKVPYHIWSQLDVAL